MGIRSYLRSVFRTSFCAAVSLAAAFSSGPPADRQQVQAQLLDHAEFLCANCFFGPSEYFYCFAADNKILVGYQKTPVLNWEDKSKNYLAKVHPGWSAWTAPGQTVPIRYDDKHIWVNRADGQPGKRGLWTQVKALAFWISRNDAKQVKLKRSSMRDIFIDNDQCRKADTAQAH